MCNLVRLYCCIIHWVLHDIVPYADIGTGPGVAIASLQIYAMCLSTASLQQERGSKVDDMPSQPASSEGRQQLASIGRIVNACIPFVRLTALPSHHDMGAIQMHVLMGYQGLMIGN